MQNLYEEYTDLSVMNDKTLYSSPDFHFLLPFKSCYNIPTTTDNCNFYDSQIPHLPDKLEILVTTLQIYCSLPKTVVGIIKIIKYLKHMINEFLFFLSSCFLLSIQVDCLWLQNSFHCFLTRAPLLVLLKALIPQTNI